MAQQAKVSSLDAIEGFRSQLVVYLSHARPALEEVSGDVVRLRMWLEEEQRLYWENQLRRRAKALEQAQAALFSSRLGLMQRAGPAEQMAVQRAKQAFEEAEGKLKTLKRWRREFDSQVQPLVKQMEKLHTVLSNDMVQAVAYLNQVLNTLAAYSERTPIVSSSEPSAPAAPAGSEAAPANPETGENK